MIKWVTDGSPDIRYRLCSLLSDPAFQDRYSMILIDCPPRITTATINALCASTNLVIPTKLDEMSAEACLYFIKQLDRMSKLFPQLKVTAIVPMMTTESVRLTDYEERARDRLVQFSEKRGVPELLMMDQRIPSRTDIARDAGVGVSYVRRRACRPFFQKLGDELLARLR
jgi:cellulose biosynthesis protein BcsQ